MFLLLVLHSRFAISESFGCPLRCCICRHLPGRLLGPSCLAQSLLEPGGMFLDQTSPKNFTDMLRAYQNCIDRYSQQIVKVLSIYMRTRGVCVLFNMLVWLVWHGFESYYQTISNTLLLGSELTWAWMIFCRRLKCCERFGFMGSERSFIILICLCSKLVTPHNFVVFWYFSRGPMFLHICTEDKSQVLVALKGYRHYKWRKKLWQHES